MYIFTLSREVLTLSLHILPANSSQTTAPPLGRHLELDSLVSRFVETSCSLLGPEYLCRLRWTTCFTYSQILVSNLWSLESNAFAHACCVLRQLPRWFSQLSLHIWQSEIIAFCMTVYGYVFRYLWSKSTVPFLFRALLYPSFTEKTSQVAIPSEGECSTLASLDWGFRPFFSWLSELFVYSVFRQ